MPYYSALVNNSVSIACLTRKAYRTPCVSHKPAHSQRLECVAFIARKTGGDGIEPSYWAPKAHVLPLDDPPILRAMQRHNASYKRTTAPTLHKDLRFSSAHSCECANVNRILKCCACYVRSKIFNIPRSASTSTTSPSLSTRKTTCSRNPSVLSEGLLVSAGIQQDSLPSLREWEPLLSFRQDDDI